MGFSGSWSNIGETSAKFSASFTGGDKSYTGYRYVRLYVEGVGIYEIKSSSAGGAGSRFSKTVRGLEAGTEYYWAARLGYDGGGSIVWLDVTDDGYFTTEEERILIELWDWDANGARRRAYTAITSNGNLSDFSYTVWNDLVDKVKEILDALSESWNSSYASYSSTRMSSSDKNITAVRFNSLRQNLADYRTFSTWIPVVSKGDTVYGAYFVNFGTEINRWINSL